MTALTRKFPLFSQIKLDIVPDKSWQTEDMFVPAGYHMNSHIASDDSAPKEVGEPPYTRHEKSPLPRIKCVVKGFVKATFARDLITFDAHQRSALKAPLSPRSKAVKAVFTHM